MQIQNDTIKFLREEYGDSFYLLDSTKFRENFLELKEAFSLIYPDFNIAYSYKTNYTPKFCKIVNELGGYAEVVSEMEVELALRCGVEPSKIIWNGPIKHRTKLLEFLQMGVTVNIDSVEEAEYIQYLACNSEKIFNVGIRCNFDVNDGVVSRFGIDVDSTDFDYVLNIVQNTNNIKFINFHCHFAKRHLEFWPARAQGMIRLIDKYGIVPDRIDIGGGLFGKMGETLIEQFPFVIPTYKQYAEEVATIFRDYFENRKKKPELVIEPGTAIVGDCMQFVATVKTIKKIRGKFIATVLGSQKNINMTGINPPIEVIHMSSGKKYDNLDIVGYTCIEGDVIYTNFKGEVAVNDMIVISNCGSYSLVMKSPFILPNFPVIDISESKVEVIKRGENFEDIFRTFSF